MTGGVPLAATLALLGLCVATPAFAATPESGTDHFDRGKQAFERGDLTAALSDFEAALAAADSGPAVHYNIGVTAYRLGRYSRAESAFREVARTAAMKPLAEYNLGLINLRRGDRAAAQRLFSRVAASDADDKLRALAIAQLARLAAEPAPVWAGFAGLYAGYDDNVALIADAGVLDVSGTDDAFVEARFGLSGPLDRPISLDAGLLYLDYLDLNEFDQLALSAGGRYRARAAGWHAEIGLHAGYNTFDGEGIESKRMMTLQASRRFASGWELRPRYRFSHIDGLGAFHSLSGSRHQIGARGQKRSGGTNLQLEYEFESNDRQEDAVSPTRHLLFAAVRRDLSGDWTLGADLSYRYSRYDIDMASTREEHRAQLGLNVNRRLTRSWEVVIRYDFTQNHSNAADFDYSRNRLSIGTNKLFR